MVHAHAPHDVRITGIGSYLPQVMHSNATFGKIVLRWA